MTKILVVDDEADLEVLVKQKFRKKIREQEYEFVFAANGVEALDQLEKHTDVDVVLSDINMPEMNGEEMISRIRKNPIFKELPMVVVSTEGSTTRISALLSNHGVGFVHKPFTPERLSQVVHEVTGGEYGEEPEGPSAPVSGPDF